MGYVIEMLPDKIAEQMEVQIGMMKPEEMANMTYADFRARINNYLKTSVHMQRSKSGKRNLGYAGEERQDHHQHGGAEDE